MLPVVVLKFGSSVLAGPKDLPVVVDEIYRHLRKGKRVLAIVSAFEGETDRLFASAKENLAPPTDAYAVAQYVTRGEWHSSSELVNALMRSGVDVRMVGPHGIGLRVEGGALEADPVSVDAKILQALFETHTTLVMPGYFGVDQKDRMCLLGRGGSDLSAIFIAGALGAPCHLVKDVPGVFDVDPAADPTHARRYSVIPWQDASKVAGPLIQPKALVYAERHRIPFVVSRANGTLMRVTAGVKAEWGESAESTKRLRVALLGFGTVGGGVYERLQADPERFEVVAVVARDLRKAIAQGLPSNIVTPDFDLALGNDIDLLIECMGGVEPATCLLDEALERGKYVVTANKAAVAANWDAFSKFSVGPERRLWCSAAVGGAVPILGTLARLGPRIKELRGVVSGTCNFVLDAQEGGLSFAEAVREAQHAGYAEADPERDISGADCADKLSLIAHAAFGVSVRPEDIPTLGVGPAIGTEFQSDSMRLWRLVASAVNEQGRVKLSVAPELVDRTSFLGLTHGAENRVEVVLENGAVVRLAGLGAGRWPTTTAVMGDVYEVLRQARGPGSVKEGTCAVSTIESEIA